MDRAHAPLLELIATIPPKRLNSVIDFGCGNGALLQKIVSGRRGCVPHGVDVSASRIEHALLLQPRFRENFEVRSMFDPSGKWLQSEYALGVLMVGRLLEVTPRQRAEFLGWIKSRCERMLLYFYGGWIEAGVGLAELARRCNLQLLEMHPSKSAAFANLAAMVV